MAYTELQALCMVCTVQTEGEKDMNEEIMIQEVSVDGNPTARVGIGGAGCGVVCLGLGCADGGGPAPTGVGCGVGCDGAGCAGGGLGAGCAWGINITFLALSITTFK